MHSIEVPAADGVMLSGERHGPDRGPAIVFLHGGGQSRSAWRGAAIRLGGAGYRAITMDLRGHGDSGWSDDVAYGFDAYVGDLMAVVAALDAAPAIFVGASLGGHIALLAAARHPDSCRALLLADVTPYMDEAIGDTMRAKLRDANRGFDSIAKAAAMVSQLRGAPPPAHGAEGLRRHLREAADGRLYFRWDPRLMNDALLRGGGEGGVFQQAAVALTVPVLVMRAALSNLTDAAQVEAFRAVQPRLDAVVIPGIGHMVSGDANDAYADTILDYLHRRHGVPLASGERV